MIRLALFPTFLILLGFGWAEPAAAEAFGDDWGDAADWDCPQSHEIGSESIVIEQVQNDDVLPCATMDAGFGAFCQNAQVFLLSHEGITFCRVTFPELKGEPLPVYESRRAQPPTSNSTIAPVAVTSQLGSFSPPGAQTRSMWPTHPRLKSTFFEKTPAKPG